MKIQHVYQQALQFVGIGAVDTFSIHQLLQFHHQFQSVHVLLTNLDIEMKNYSVFMEQMERLKKGEPVAYILGYTTFLGLQLEVNPSVLIPRQETEELVMHASQLFPRTLSINVIDVGTGSGAIALALKSIQPNWKITATDISQAALNVAKHNANNLNLKLQFHLGDGLKTIDPSYENNVELIISNPPYVEFEQHLDPFVQMYEPKLALIANPQTKFYEQYLLEGKRLIAPHGIFAFEIDPSLEAPLQKVSSLIYPSAVWKWIKDINGKTRFGLLYT